MPRHASLLQAVFTLLLGTRLLLRSQKEAGALGLDDVSLYEGHLYDYNSLENSTTCTGVSCRDDVHSTYHHRD